LPYPSSGEELFSIIEKKDQDQGEVEGAGAVEGAVEFAVAGARDGEFKSASRRF